MRVLALATTAELEGVWRDLDAGPGHQLVRPPETGMVLVRGRVGGSGPPFNLGEMTVTRCTVRVVGGAIGTAYVAGTDRRHAELAALFDALLQDPAQTESLQETLVEPLAQKQAHRQRVAAEKTAATKVDFFTMVRGDG